MLSSTLIAFIEKASSKFNLSKPVIVADAGLLSKLDIAALEEKNYEYIIGVRLKNEAEKIKNELLRKKLSDGQVINIKKPDNTRLVVTYTSNRAAKDAPNRRRDFSVWRRE